MGSEPFVERGSCSHNEDFECADCATQRHVVEHPETVEGCRVCKFATIQLAPSCFPSKPRRFGKPRDPLNSWEKGIVKDERGLPLLKGVGQPISVKEYAENRHSIEAKRTALKQGAVKTPTKE